MYIVRMFERDPGFHATGVQLMQGIHKVYLYKM